MSGELGTLTMTTKSVEASTPPLAIYGHARQPLHKQLR